MLEAKEQEHNTEVISPRIKKNFAPKIGKFSGKFMHSPGIKMFSKIFRELSSVLQNETKLVMILAYYFHLLKK